MILDGLFRDPTLSDLLSDQQRLAYLLEAELALAEGLAAAGFCHIEDVLALRQHCALFKPDLTALQRGMTQDGVIIPALVKALRVGLAPAPARALHFGATSQDIMDTATVLEARAVLAHFEHLLRDLVAALLPLIQQHQQDLVAGRTRSQQAAPINLGLKIARWLEPLLRQLERLEPLRQDVLYLQLAGAAGNCAAYQDRAQTVRQVMAEHLQLQAQGGWHTQRDRIQQLSHWCATTTTALGKMALDWMLMAQSEVGECLLSNGGGSSTLPHKSNPVTAEIIQTLARRAAQQAAELQLSGLAAHERDGVAWSHEWLALPELYQMTGAALQHSHTGLQHLTFDTQQMRHNLWASRGLLFAETLRFQLEATQHSNAPQIIDTCIAQLRSQTNTNTDLLDLVNAQADTTFTRQSLTTDLLHAGCTQEDIERVLSRAQAWLPHV